MVKRIIFAAALLILSIATFSQSIPKLNFTGFRVNTFDKNEIKVLDPVIESIRSEAHLRRIQIRRRGWSKVV